MKRMQAYKYELKPNGDQRRNMRRFAGSCRFVFNKALAMQKALYAAGEKKLFLKSCADMRNFLGTEVRNEPDPVARQAYQRKSAVPPMWAAMEVDPRQYRHPS